MMNQENSYLLKLAWRNIRRNSGRSFFIGLSVTLSVTMAVWIMSFFDGLNYQIEDAVVKGNIGYYQVQEKKFSETSDTATPLIYDASWKNRIKKWPILSYSPELLLDGYISAPEGSASLLVIGVNFKLNNKMMKLADHMVEGKWPRQSQRGVVIGKELAQKFYYHVGDTFVLNYQDIHGELKSELIPILGIYNKNGRSFERRNLYMSEDLVEELFFGSRSKEFKFHRIVMMSKNLFFENKIKQGLRSIEDVMLKNWKQLNPEMSVILDFHSGMIKIFFLIVGLTISVTILTPVSMLWQERLPELKMMNIIGVPNKKIWKLGLFEVTLMIFSSFLASSFVLIALITFFNQSGINFGFLNRGQIIERAGIELPATIYPLLHPLQILYIFIFVTFVMFVSYVWAIYSTLKKLEAES